MTLASLRHMGNHELNAHLLEVLRVPFHVLMDQCLDLYIGSIGTQAHR